MVFVYSRLFADRSGIDSTKQIYEKLYFLIVLSNNLLVSINAKGYPQNSIHKRYVATVIKLPRTEKETIYLVTNEISPQFISHRYSISLASTFERQQDQQHLSSVVRHFHRNDTDVCGIY